MKKIYYYNKTYPEYGLQELEVKDELYLVGKDIKVLQYIAVDYDIHTDKKAEDMWINIYAPYEDEEIYQYDCNGGIGSHYIMSYNKEKINDWYKDDFNSKKKYLEERLKRFEVEK